MFSAQNKYGTFKRKKNKFEKWMVHAVNMIQRNLVPWELFFSPINNKKLVWSKSCKSKINLRAWNWLSRVQEYKLLLLPELTFIYRFAVWEGTSRLEQRKLNYVPVPLATRRTVF